MPIQIISGDPGQVYRNDSDKILWQFHCNFANSCGRCIQLANLIGPFWPTPIHRRCNCKSIPVPPGDSARPFVNYQAEVRDLSRDQQARVMGASSWRLVDQGVVPWDEVVTRGRIRTFREVIDRLDLKPAQLTKAGIAPGLITRAYADTASPAVQASDQARSFLVSVLQAQGFTVDQVKQEIKRTVAARVGIRLDGPQPAAGPTRPGSVPARTSSATPAVSSLGQLAKLAGPVAVVAIERYLLARLQDHPEETP